MDKCLSFIITINVQLFLLLQDVDQSIVKGLVLA